MTGSIIYSAGLDFSYSFTHTGDPTQYQLMEHDIITIPAGLPMLSSSLLFTAYSFSINPGTQIGQGTPASTQLVGSYVKSDTPFERVDNVTASDSGVVSPYRNAANEIFHSAFSSLGWTTLSTLTLGLTAYFKDATESLTGSVVVCVYTTDDSAAEFGLPIVDGFIPSLTITGSQADSISTEANTPPITATVPYAVFGSVDGAMGFIASVADSGSAAMPSFAGDPGWVDVIARTNGAHSVAIGQYIGTVDTALPLPFKLSYSKGRGYAQITQLGHIVTSRPRSVGQVVG